MPVDHLLACYFFENFYRASYGYDLAGNLTSQTYPSGRTVTTIFDAAGRMSGVSGQKSGEGTKNYLSQVSYSAAGTVTQMRLGNGLWESTVFNSRLQATRIGLGASGGSISVVGLDYGYGTSANNGNVTSQTISAPGLTLTQSYGYDELNRLKTATESGVWSQTYSYDQYGNRAVTAGYVPNTTLTPQTLTAFNASNNRLVGSSYDAAGNQVQDAAGRTFSYDGENRQVSFNGGTATYSYDGDGRRVKKVDGAGTTIFVYNVMGQMVAEYSTTPPQGAGGTSYLTADHLGSTRVVTKQDQSVKARYDYWLCTESLLVVEAPRN